MLQKNVKILLAFCTCYSRCIVLGVQPSHSKQLEAYPLGHGGYMEAQPDKLFHHEI